MVSLQPFQPEGKNSPTHTLKSVSLTSVESSSPVPQQEVSFGADTLFAVPQQAGRISSTRSSLISGSASSALFPSPCSKISVSLYTFRSTFLSTIKTSESHVSSFYFREFEGYLQIQHLPNTSHTALPG